MDQKKIGQFLAQLRKEQNLTQEKLGEELGVSNKTISRWENGNYLPPVEMLQLLSERYQISINEILSGQRVTEAEYRENAESNLKTVLAQSVFTLTEKKKYYRSKWLKEHLSSYLILMFLCIILMIIGIVRLHILIVVALVLAAAIYLIGFNRMMAYIEKDAFDGKSA